MLLTPPGGVPNLIGQVQLREHGFGDPGEFWDIQAGRERDSFFGEFILHGGWRAVLRAWLRR